MLLFIGIVLVYSKNSNVSILIALFASGELLGVLSVFLQKKSRELIIDTDKTILPRGADKNEKNGFSNCCKTKRNLFC